MVAHPLWSSEAAEVRSAEPALPTEASAKSSTSSSYTPLFLALLYAQEKLYAKINATYTAEKKNEIIRHLNAATAAYKSSAQTPEDLDAYNYALQNIPLRPFTERLRTRFPLIAQYIGVYSSTGAVSHLCALAAALKEKHPFENVGWWDPLNIFSHYGVAKRILYAPGYLNLLVKRDAYIPRTASTKNPYAQYKIEAALGALFSQHAPLLVIAKKLGSQTNKASKIFSMVNHVGHGLTEALLTFHALDIWHQNNWYEDLANPLILQNLREFLLAKEADTNNDLENIISAIFDKNDPTVIALPLPLSTTYKRTLSQFTLAQAFAHVILMPIMVFANAGGEQIYKITTNPEVRP